MKKIIRDSLGWDCETWSAAFDFWEAFLPKGNQVLELGNGRYGGLSLWFARMGYEVTCSGYSDEYLTYPKNTARYFDQHGLLNKVNFAHVDATNLASSSLRSQYDIICFKSMLGGIVRDNGIDIAQRVINQCYEKLNPGGVLLFAENLQATLVHDLLRSRFGAGKNAWRYFSSDELVSFQSKFESFSFQTVGFSACFGRKEWQRNALATLDFMLEPLIPSCWRYCLIGAARK